MPSIGDLRMYYNTKDWILITKKELTKEQLELIQKAIALTSTQQGDRQ